MKSLFALVTILSLISCGNGYNKDGNFYVGTIQLKDGASNPQKVKFKLDPYVVDTLKLSKDQINKIFEETVNVAKSSLKNTYSFEFLPSTENSGMIYSMPSDNYISVSVDYVGQNGFGVKSKNMGFVKFEKKSFKILEKVF